jgi:predicted transcriptional regulator
VLSTNLVKKIDLFVDEKSAKKKEKGFYSEDIEDRALGKVHDLGVKIAVFKHAPFKAFSHGSEDLIIGKGAQRIDIEKKAVTLGKTKNAFESKPLIITKQVKYQSVGHVPIVGEEELDTLSKFKDLMQIIREREKLD